MTQQQKPRVALTLELNQYLKRHTDIFAGAAQFAAERGGWTCVIDDFAEETICRSGRFRSGRRNAGYDGVIGRISAGLAAAARRRRLPVVNVWLNSPAKNRFGVYPDFAQAGDLAAEHMLSRGLRRLACVYRHRDPGESRLAERFKALAAQAGCACDMLPVAVRFAHSAATWNRTRSLLQDWLLRASPPVGVLASLDILGRHVAQIASEAGRHVPRDVAIVSAHNEPTLCLYPEPTLSSIEYGYDRIGREAAQMMDALLSRKAPPAMTVLVPPRELVVRHSSDFTFIDDEVVTAALQFISQNARKSIGVDDISSAAKVSRRTLEQRFARHLGHSVAEEVRRVRLDHAKRLLASSQMTSAQIALATGFGTAQQMARVFRRQVEASPSEYRALFATKQ